MLIKTAASKFWPWCLIKTVTNLDGRNFTILDEESLLGKIMPILVKNLDFNYTIVNQMNLPWGVMDIKTNQTNSNSMIGMIHRNVLEIDFAFGPFEIGIGNRDLVADVSTLIAEQQLSFLSTGKNAKQSHDTLGLWSLIQSFEIIVWLLTLIFFFCVVLIFSALEIIEYEHERKGFRGKNYQNNKAVSILANYWRVSTRNAWNFFGNIFKQNLKVEQSLMKKQLFLKCITWTFPSFFIIHLFYSSMVLAQLLAVPFKYIDSLSDLAKVADSVMLVTKAASSYESHLTDQSNHDMKRIYSQCLNRFGRDQCLATVDEILSERSLEETLKGNRVIFRTTTDFKHILSGRVAKRKSCGFHIASESFKRAPLTLLFNKNFDKKLKRRINSKILEIFDRVPFRLSIMTSGSDYKECLFIPSNDYEPVVMYNIRGILFVLAICYHLAIFIFFAELLVWCKNINNMQRKRNLRMI